MQSVQLLHLARAQYDLCCAISKVKTGSVLERGNVLSEGDITRLLNEIKGGNRQAQADLIPLVYDELRRVAHAHMRKERAEHTLQATALVHEAYLKLVDSPQIDWQGRAHFFALAAQLMRRILVDYARAHRADKRGGPEEKLSLDEALVLTGGKREER